LFSTEDGVTDSRAPRVAVIARAVAPLHGVGGLERSVHDLVRHLSGRGVAVTLIAPPPRDDQNPDALFPGVVFRAVPYVTFPFANRRGTTVLDRSTAYPLFGWRAGGIARALAAAGAVDIVHGFGASVLGYARARRRAGVPLVFNPQGLEEFGATADRQSLGKRLGYWPLRRAVLACSREADVVIATDRALEPTVARHLQLRPGQMRTIPNGIDLEIVDRLADAEAGRAMRATHAIGMDDDLLLTAGRVEHNKGLDVLALALGQLVQRPDALSTSWRWVVAGSGPFAPGLRRLVDELGLAAHVVFAGRVSDAHLHAWYEAATLFVHPTRYEGSSIVTLEAMAHRKAIVATRAGGLPDKVQPGINGWLVEPGDSAALAAAIADGLRDRAQLDRMGASSRRLVESQFAWSVLTNRYVQLYEELLARSVR
jgi:glycosyltransferase involved in cell wall biosynthesis